MYLDCCLSTLFPALELKKINYEYKAVYLVEEKYLSLDKDGGEQQREEFQKINPMGQVRLKIVDFLQFALLKSL